MTIKDYKKLGPSASIPLKHALTDEQIQDLEQWLRSITARLEDQPGDWWPFWIADGCLPDIEATDYKEACAFGIGFVTAQVNLDTLDEEIHIEVRAEQEQTHEQLGYIPEQNIEIYAGCNQKSDHRILGQLALQLARRYGNIIDLGGAIWPPLKPGQSVFDVTLGETEQYIEQLSLPGRIFPKYYTTANNRPGVSYMINVEFMRAWLQHPHFHMIK